MKPRANVITAPEGTTTEQAYSIMKQQKVKKLPIVDKDGQLAGMYVWNDVREDQEKHNSFSLDEEGHFLVGAGKKNTIRYDFIWFVLIFVQLLVWVLQISKELICSLKLVAKLSS